MILYKHMEPKWLDSFCSGRSVRIGTLSEFRKEETHKQGIGDRLEGRSERRVDGRFEKIHPGSIEAKRLRSVGIGGMEAGSDMVFEDVVYRNEHPDVYIFCLSKSLDAPVSPTYTAVARISDIVEFGLALYRGLMQYGVTDVFSHGPVTYRDDIDADLFRSGLPPRNGDPFEKHTRFAAQNEYRILLRPTKRPIQARNLVVDFPAGLVEPV